MNKRQVTEAELAELTSSDWATNGTLTARGTTRHALVRRAKRGRAGQPQVRLVAVIKTERAMDDGATA